VVACVKFFLFGYQIALLVREINASGIASSYRRLVTGLKHYLGPFEDHAKTELDTPLREEMPLACHFITMRCNYVNHNARSSGSCFEPTPDRIDRRGAVA
jgi:hypothetical protein